jgi:hypothetical protein
MPRIPTILPKRRSERITVKVDETTIGAFQLENFVDLGGTSLRLCEGRGF